MEQLVNQLETLREEAHKQFGNQFTDSLHAQIYKEWHSIMHHLEMNGHRKLILMRLVELKWHCQTTFTARDLSRDLKMSPVIINNHLEKLTEAGLCYKSEGTSIWQITLNKLF